MRPQRHTKAPHGTVGRYLSGCSCLTCCDAWAEYQRERKADLKQGIARLVDAGPVRERIAELKEAGFSRRAIAESAGVSYGTLRLIESGESDKVRRDTAEALMGCTGRPRSSTARVPLGPTRALMRRLGRLRGMTLAQIAQEGGLGRSSLAFRKGQKTVSAWIAVAVEDVARTHGLARSSGKAEYVLLAEAFDRICASCGYERPAIAEAAGMSEEVYRHVRKGRPVSEDHAERLSAALGVSMQTLFTITEEAAA